MPPSATIGGPCSKRVKNALMESSEAVNCKWVMDQAAPDADDQHVTPIGPDAAGAEGRNTRDSHAAGVLGERPKQLPCGGSRREIRETGPGRRALSRFFVRIERKPLKPRTWAADRSYELLVGD
jgi:hypothetical protein